LPSDYTGIAHDVLRSYNKILRMRSENRRKQLEQISAAIGSDPMPEMMKAVEGAHLGDRQPMDYDRMKALHGIDRLTITTQQALEDFATRRVERRGGWDSLVIHNATVGARCWPLFRSMGYTTTQTSQTVIPNELRPEANYYERQQIGQPGGGITINMPTTKTQETK